MFDRSGSFIKYDTEQEMLAVLRGDRLNPDLQSWAEQAMVVDAASHGWHTALDLMLTEMDYSVDEVDHKNYTPLGYAAMVGRTKTVKCLLFKYGADPRTRNNAGPHMFKPGEWFQGYTALELALDNKHYGTADVLVGVLGSIEPSDLTDWNDLVGPDGWLRKLCAYRNLATLWRGVLAYKHARSGLFAWLERAQLRLDAYGTDGAARKRDRAAFEADDRPCVVCGYGDDCGGIEHTSCCNRPFHIDSCCFAILGCNLAQDHGDVVCLKCKDKKGV